MQARRRAARALIVLSVLAFAWTGVLLLTGGFRLEWRFLRVSSRTPDLPLQIALVTLGAWLILRLIDSLGQLAARGDPAAPSAAREPSGVEQSRSGRLLRGLTVLALSAGYFAWVFQLPSGVFLRAGLDTWLDAYFINYLQEHWLVSALTLSDPASPPMYYPARGALGYSHGLVLFAPAYVAARLFFHPFAANTVALFAIMVAGSVSLYLVFRRMARLSFPESLLLSAFFWTSANIINIGTGQWTQRASVFLIPPIVLLAHDALTRPRVARGSGAERPASAGSPLVRLKADAPRAIRLKADTLRAIGAGLAAALLLTQDAYTALFAALLTALLCVPCVIASSGRPVRAWLTRLAGSPPGLGLLLGAYAGVLIFLWCYLPSLREHQAFPSDHLEKALVARDPASWGTPMDLFRDLRVYDTPRIFWLVLAVALTSWLPAARLSLAWRRYTLWFLLITVIAAIVPFDFSGFSPWRSLFAPWPGLAAIRDPRRIIYLYELAAVGVAAWYVARMPARSLPRLLIVALAIALLAADRHRNLFSYRRSTAAFSRWVEAPITIDPGCASFFVKRASADYEGRTDDMWGLYNIDAMFIATRTGVPTLNGYSAWYPEYWGLQRPPEPGYLSAVDDWIALNELRNVCALDIDARVMTPYVPAVRPAP